MDPYTQKYEHLPTPKSYDDIKGNYSAVKALRSHLKDAEPVVCLVIGGTCSGKSSLFEVIQNEHNFEALRIDESIHSDVERCISNFVNYKTITSMFSSPRCKLIFVDDIDVMLQIEKSMASIIQKYKKQCAFVLTVTCTEERKISSIKKLTANVVRLSKPSLKEAYLILSSLYEEEKNYSDDVLLKVLKQNDLHIVNTHMHMCSFLKDGRNSSGSSESRENQRIADNIYDSVRSIITKKMSEETLWFIASHDAVMTSMLFHENIPYVRANKKDTIDEYINFYEHLSCGDMIDHMTYSRCMWGIVVFDIIFYAILLTGNRLASKYESNIAEIKFTQQFTKLSSRIATRKHIKSTCNDYGGNGKLLSIVCMSQQVGKNDDIVKKVLKDFKDFT